MFASTIQMNSTEEMRQAIIWKGISEVAMKGQENDTARFSEDIFKRRFSFKIYHGAWLYTTEGIFCTLLILWLVDFPDLTFERILA